MNPSRTLVDRIKTAHLTKLTDYTRKLYRKPELRKLFFELTLQCNERCFHCGSSCTAARCDELCLDNWLGVIDQVKADFGTSNIQLCITGGEPLLNPDFFAILSHAYAQGFKWGMTSNATLITPQVAQRLFRETYCAIGCAMCGTIDLSSSGMTCPTRVRSAVPAITCAFVAGTHTVAGTTTQTVPWSASRARCSKTREVTGHALLAHTPKQSRAPQTLYTNRKRRHDGQHTDAIPRWGLLLGR